MRTYGHRSKFWRLLIRRLGRDESGQDMIEYALLAAALVIIVAGFMPVQVIPAVSTIFERILTVMNAI